MRTEIRVTEGGGGKPPFYVLNEAREIPESEAPRTLKEPWLRISRVTYDDNDRAIKCELGIFGYRDGDFEILWREYKVGTVLTDVAPMSDYLVWQK